MKTIDKEYSSIYEINKSKFISYAYPVSSVEMIEKLLDNLRKEYNDATHICFAYILSSPVSEKCSDDGEPAGTAGKPILELLKKKGLENILVVSVRYFGGIKLGAGGLIRAYTTSAKLVIDKTTIVNASLGYRCEIISDLANVNKLKSKLTNLMVSNLKIDYGETVKISFVINDVDRINELNPSIIGREIYVSNQN